MASGYSCPSSSLSVLGELDSLLVNLGSHGNSAPSLEAPVSSFPPSSSSSSTLSPSTGNQTQYVCPWCQRIFNKSSNLKRHILTHTGEKPYACALCPYRAVQKVQVFQHLRSKHSWGVNQSSTSRESFGDVQA